MDKQKVQAFEDYRKRTSGEEWTRQQTSNNAWAKKNYVTGLGEERKANNGFG